jgi:adenylate kinase family enzyme
VAQAETLAKSVKIDFVLNIDVPFDTIVDRLKVRPCGGVHASVHPSTPPSIAG